MAQAAADAAREIRELTERTMRNVQALGAAIHVAHAPLSPALARSVQAEQNLYDDIEREFGLLTSAEAGRRMGSRSSALRNAATAARREGRLLAVRRGSYWLFPGFQFDAEGLRPVVAELIALARDRGRGEAGLVQWLCSPTTYLGGARPVDVLDDPDRLLEVADQAFGIQW
jgi:hypothetical protein